MSNDTVTERWSAEVLRSRTYRRIRGVETYALKFSYTEGDRYIQVAFRGQVEHDVINVYDHATGTVKVSSKREVKALVNEYMQGMTANELRKRFEESRPGSLAVR
jgi:hypothetical protein